jgi:amino-acid N-acetyltransferase
MTEMGFQTSTLGMPAFDEWTHLPTSDPASIEIVSLDHEGSTDETDEELFEEKDSLNAMYPFVNMLRGSARYIADHQGETCVFHLPGEMLESEGFNKLMDDIALAWLLGLKIVIVAGCRTDVECSVGGGPGCQNSLRVTDDRLLRFIEEEAGYVRFEVERQLNRSLRIHGGMSKVDVHSPLPSGNVVGGNFYTAKPFGVVRGKDYQNTGYPSHVNTEKIQDILERDDIVLLTTVGCSRLGSCVNVNGNHLAASVASALDAHKLVYFANQGTVLRKRDNHQNTIQDIPVSVVKAFLDYHKVQVHRAGFASFKEASKELDSSGAVEMLLHLGWASWALEQGVKRAHIVNPGDGSLLEELYTAKHGTNTCLFRDDEKDEFDDDVDDFDILSSIPDDQEEILFSELPNGN